MPILIFPIGQVLMGISQIRGFEPGDLFHRVCCQNIVYPRQVAMCLSTS